MPLFFQFIGKKEGNIMKGDISPHIEENEAYIRKRLENCDDFIIRPMLLGEEKKIRCLVVYIEVAVSNMVLEDSVIGKLVNHMCCLLYTSPIPRDIS